MLTILTLLQAYTLCTMVMVVIGMGSVMLNLTFESHRRR